MNINKQGLDKYKNAEGQVNLTAAFIIRIRIT